MGNDTGKDDDRCHVIGKRISVLNGFQNEIRSFRIFYGEETIGEHNQNTGKRQESNQNRMCFPYSGNDLDTFRKISGNATDDAACEKSD